MEEINVFDEMKEIYGEEYEEEKIGKGYEKALQRKKQER